MLFIEGSFNRNNQLPFNSYKNVGCALIETVGIANMHNACRLWHIVTDYTFTENKEKSEVIVSLPPHNVNATF